MKIQTTSADLTSLACDLLAGGPVSAPVVRIGDNEVSFGGSWHGIPFETFWTLEIDGGKLLATPVRFKIVGVPFLKVLIYGLMKSTVAGRDGLALKGESVQIDAAKLAKVNGSIDKIKCYPDVLILEASLKE